MALFPNLNINTYDPKNADILKKMEHSYESSISFNESLWYEGLLNLRFEAGDSSVFSEVYGTNSIMNFHPYSFNRIRRVTNMISGSQRKDRKSIIATPRGEGDQKIADQFTKVLFWLAQTEGLLETISDGFHGSSICSLTLLQIWIDFRKDPDSGDIKVDYCPHNTFLIDPFFSKKDLSDCNFIWKRSFLSKEEILSLLPEEKKLIDDITPGLSTTGRMDNKFGYIPQALAYDLDNIYSYDEYYYKTFRHQKYLYDAERNESFEWTVENEKGLQKFLNDYPQIEVKEQYVPTVKLAIVVNGTLVKDDINPCGIDEYPFVPILAYFNPASSDSKNRFQSVVTSLRDPQYLYNIRRIGELRNTESTSEAGWIVKENALVDPTAPFRNEPGIVLVVKEDAQMTDIQKIMPNEVPPNSMQLTELLAREVMEISGVNEELLGSSIDDKAGVLAALRQAAGRTTLNILFDNLDIAMKILGKKLVGVIQSNFKPIKIQGITEEEPAEAFFNKNFGEFDIAIEEGLNTTTQRQLQFAQMLTLKEAGVPISPEDLIEASTIQNKQKIIDRMQAQQQQEQQQQQQVAQTQMELQKANANLANARAHADYKLGDERDSRIPENRALAIERISEANKNDELAELNKIKAMKELEDMDISQLERLLAIAQVLKDDSEQNKEELQSDAEVVPARMEQDYQPAEEESLNSLLPQPQENTGLM